MDSSATMRPVMPAPRASWSLSVEILARSDAFAVLSTPLKASITTSTAATKPYRMGLRMSARKKEFSSSSPLP